jgi:hypothetical protein
MKNREATLKKLDQIESNLSKINLALNQGNRQVCYQIMGEIRTQIDQCKLYIESENIVKGELNNLR